MSYAKYLQTVKKEFAKAKELLTEMEKEFMQPYNTPDPVRIRDELAKIQFDIKALKLLM